MDATCVKQKKKRLIINSFIVRKHNLCVNQFFALFKVQWVMHSIIRGVFLSWCKIFVGKERKKARKATMLCLFWTILRERNRRAFDNCETMDQLIKKKKLYLFWDWVRLYNEVGSMLLVDFVDWLSFV